VYEIYRTRSVIKTNFWQKVNSQNQLNWSWPWLLADHSTVPIGGTLLGTVLLNILLDCDTAFNFYTNLLRHSELWPSSRLGNCQYSSSLFNNEGITPSLIKSYEISSWLIKSAPAWLCMVVLLTCYHLFVSFSSYPPFFGYTIFLIRYFKLELLGVFEHIIPYYLSILQNALLNRKPLLNINFVTRFVNPFLNLEGHNSSNTNLKFSPPIKLWYTD